MALFEQKVWTDRQVQFPSRRKLTNVNTQEEKTVIVERNEGIIYEEGNLFDAANINDLEERVASAFNEVEEALNNRINLYYPVGKIFMAVTDLHLEDPAQQVFPGTTWIKLENRVLLPVDPDTEESGVEGGSNTVEITPAFNSLSFTGTSGGTVIDVAHMPSHSHQWYDSWREADEKVEYDFDHGIHAYRPGGYYGHDTGGATNASGQAHNHAIINPQISFTGTKSTVSVVQRFITVFAWKRLG